ncbi:MAG: 30S ribosomal protein S20 [Pirellulales bacterium]
MPNNKAAAKRHRQSEGRRVRNRSVKSSLKTQIKKVHAVLPAGDAAETTAAVRTTQKALDQAAAKGVIHKNKAARLKSRLVKKVKAAKTAAAAK